MKISDWLSTYIDYTKEQESPDLFHLWVGISVIAATLGRNVFLDRGYYTLFPNMYIVLIAPSGKCRKTTAGDIGMNIFSDAGGSVIRDKVTPRALTQYLADQIEIKDKVAYGDSRGYIYASEFSEFLSQDASQSGLIKLITGIYGCPEKWEYRTATQGRDFLYNVCVNILGCSVPDWMMTDAMVGGLAARMIFAAQLDTPRRRATPKVTEKMKKQREGLVEMLKKLAQVKMELQLSPQAEKFYEEWYEDKEGALDERFASFVEREHDHMLKIAMVVSASRGDMFRSNIISQEHLNDAIVILDQVKSCMHLAYVGIGEHIAAKGYERIISLIEQFGGRAEHSILLRRLYYHFDSEMFRKCIDLLVETGRLRCEIKGTKRVYILVRERRE